MRTGRQTKNYSLTEPVTVWGVHPVEECLKVRPSACQSIVLLPSFGRKKNQARLKRLMRESGVEFSQVADFKGLGLPDHVVHQGIVALVKPFWFTGPEGLIAQVLHTGKPLLVCDQISDPQNLGAIIRASAALGATGIVLSRRHSAGITGTVIKASAGAVFHMDVVMTQNIPRALREMKEAGLWIFGLDAMADVDIHHADLHSIPLALVAGSEQKGLRTTVKKELDLLVKIPMNPEVDSLNVSCAVSIALYECNRQRSGVSN